MSHAEHNKKQNTNDWQNTKEIQSIDSVKISRRERVVHMLMFEVIAFLILAPLSVLVTGKSFFLMSSLAIALSLIAMSWNYFYNYWFDFIFGHDRINRKLLLRIAHGCGFEFGMIIFSFPVIMWITKFDFWQVLILDIGAVLFFLIYSIIYNWIYDITREHLKKKLKVDQLGSL